MRHLIAALLLAALFGTPANAAVIYNNFGPGDSYNTGTGWTISNGSPIGALNVQGDGFTPSTTANLDFIQVAIGLVTGSNDMFFDLRADSGGSPGAVIETFHIVNQMGSFGTNNPLITLTSVLNPVLNSGQQYWLIARPGGANNWSAWNWNSSGVVGPHAFSQNGGAFSVSNTTQGAFRVVGAEAATPEPISLVVFGGLLVGGTGVALRRRMTAKATA